VSFGSRLAPCVLLVAAACSPSSIAEAERKGDVGWLEQNGTPDAVAALGRMADANPKARAALESRSSFDVEAFRAAWTAVVRGAPWGTEALRAGLADPKRADQAASAMDGHDTARITPFVGDLEQALVRLSATLQNLNVSTALASVGPAARDVLTRRLADASTRGAMCRGVAARTADADARKALLGAPVTSRDDRLCVDAVVGIAVDDDPTLAWLAQTGEPGILGAAGKDPRLPCARVHVAWTKALAARGADVYSALTVPLGYAVKRCTADMDGVVADAIAHLPATHAFVVEAIDPFEGYGQALRATCAALPLVAGGRDSALVRERARDALNHSCKN
jgi:hypothetical protein